MTSEANEVNIEALKSRGWKRYEIQQTCPQCSEMTTQHLFQEYASSGFPKYGILEIYYDPTDKLLEADGNFDMAVCRGSAVIIRHRQQ